MENICSVRGMSPGGRLPGPSREGYKSQWGPIPGVLQVEAVRVVDLGSKHRTCRWMVGEFPLGPCASSKDSPASMQHAGTLPVPALSALPHSITDPQAVHAGE